MDGLQGERGALRGVAPHQHVGLEALEKTARARVARPPRPTQAQGQGRPAGSMSRVTARQQDEGRGSSLDGVPETDPGSVRKARGARRHPRSVQHHDVEEPGTQERPEGREHALDGRGGGPTQPEQAREPAAEVAAGSRWSPTSTQAPRPPSCVTRATREQTSPVRPEEGGPWTSEIRPRGKPPPRSASIEEIPVGSGEGPRTSPRRGGASAWSRRARRRSSRELLSADDTDFAFSSPHDAPGRGSCQPQRSKLATTGAWSDGCLPLRSLRSMKAAVLRLARGWLAKMWSIRRPLFFGKASIL